MPSEPTLDELIDEAVWFLRDQGRPALIANLRAAQARLREEMAKAEAGAGVGSWALRELQQRTLTILERVNAGPAGPLPATPPATCGTCGGTRVVWRHVRFGAPAVSEMEPCPTCRPSEAPKRGTP